MYGGQLPHKLILTTAVQHLRRAVVLSVQRYLDVSSPSQAFQAFAEHIEQASPVSRLFSPDAMLSSMSLSSEKTLYRLRPMRLNESSFTEPHQLFHIAFENRHLVRPQRFSISGYPCLYAASSPQLALRELHRDSWGPDLYAVRLRALELPVYPVMLLDLRNQIELWRHRDEHRPGHYDGTLLRFLATWPLIMATSAPRMQDNGFNVEYVLPQLVLEWVNKNRIHTDRPKLSGIAFSSTRISQRAADYGGAYNVVIPVHHACQAGLCEVRIQQIEMSAPIAVSDLLAVPGNQSLSVEEFGQVVANALESQAFQRLPRLIA